MLIDMPRMPVLGLCRERRAPLRLKSEGSVPSACKKHEIEPRVPAVSCPFLDAR